MFSTDFGTTGAKIYLLSTIPSRSFFKTRSIVINKADARAICLYELGSEGHLPGFRMGITFWDFQDS